jgi:hypothetical protein
MTIPHSHNYICIEIIRLYNNNNNNNNIVVVIVIIITVIIIIINNIDQWCQGGHCIEPELGMGDEAGWRVF